MRCTCEQARREARAEAFREAAKWCSLIADVWCGGTTAGSKLTGREIRELEHRFNASADKALPTRSGRSAIVDCIEDDGFITAHVTDTDPSWPMADSGVD